MAAKKTTKKTKAKPKPRRSADPAEKATKLRGNLKLKYAAAAFELQAAQAKLETAEAKIKNLVETDQAFADALAKISQRAQFEVDVAKSLSKLQQVGRQVCDKLGIEFAEFKHYTVDTDSGLVTYLPQKTAAKAPDQE